MAIPFPSIDPSIVDIPLGPVTFSLRWYALAYIVGILIGWRLARRALLTPRAWGPAGPPMTPARLEDYVTWAILAIVLGGRLGYVLFYQPGYYLSRPAEILAVWQGGMSFHGAILALVAASVVFARRHGIPFLGLADTMALAAPPGLFLGRLANFINAELWGRPTDLPWGVIFPGDAAQDCPGIEPGLCARHPSQLYEAGLEGLVLGAVILWAIRRRRALARPGLVSGIFLIGYALARIAVETVRQPDAQFVGPGNPMGYAVLLAGDWGLTMGQILSLPMLAVGLWAIWQARRREAPAA